MLESGVDMDNDELLTCLIGAGGPARTPQIPTSDTCQQPRILEHFSDLQKYTIPEVHSERYAKKVVAKVS